MTTKRKNVKTIIFALFILVLCGLWKIAQYIIDMQYAQLAPGQVDDDSTYVWMKTEGTVTTITSFLFILVILFFLILIIRVWVKNNVTALKNP